MHRFGAFVGTQWASSGSHDQTEPPVLPVPDAPEKILERFDGFVEKIEDHTAYVTMRTSRGETLHGSYPAGELEAAGVGERSRFVLTTLDLRRDVRIEIGRFRLSSPPPSVNAKSKTRQSGCSKDSIPSMTTDPRRLSVHVLGAAKGESIVLQLPNGRWGVVDCYARSLNPTLMFLRESGVEKLEFLCLTHPHDDHYRGMSQILEEFPVAYFWHFGAPRAHDALQAARQLSAKGGHKDR